MKRYITLALFLLLPILGQSQNTSAADSSGTAEQTEETKNAVVSDKQEPIDHKMVVDEFKYYIIGWGIATVSVLLIIMVLTHRPWDSGWQNPYNNETMALPPATIRGILTLSLAYFIILLEYYRFLYPGNLMNFSVQLIAGFEIMLGFYFGGKVLQGLADSDKAKTDQITQAAKDQATATIQAAKEKAVAQSHAQEQAATLQLHQITKQKDRTSPFYKEGAEG